MQVDEKIKHEKYQIKEMIVGDRIKTQYATFSYIKVKGVEVNQTKLFACM